MSMGLISYCYNSDIRSCKRNLRWLFRLIIGSSEDEEEKKKQLGLDDSKQVIDKENAKPKVLKPSSL